MLSWAKYLNPTKQNICIPPWTTLTPSVLEELFQLCLSSRLLLQPDPTTLAAKLQEDTTIIIRQSARHSIKLTFRLGSYWRAQIG